MRLALDTETFSETPITAGVHKYAESVEILLVSYAIDDGPAQVDDLTDGDREAKLAKIAKLIKAADEIIIQNAAFDVTVLAAEGVTVPIEKVTDTMILALAHSLPASLDKLCEALDVPTDKAKDKAGKRLIQRFCKPQARNMKLRRATRETHPEEWAQFVEYARQDIPAMLAVLERLPKWNNTPRERALWRLDQAINNRGVRIDLDLAEAALRAFQRTSKELAERSSGITNGAVGSLTQRQKLLDYLGDEHDFTPADMTKGTVAAALKGELNPEVRELLEIRQQAAATSPAKYRVLLNSTSVDGRLRGTMQFGGASRTNRWSGKIFQPQNLPRPTLPADLIEAGISAMKADCEDLIFDNVSELCSSAVRGCIVAEEGKKLTIADLSNIEGRTLAWLANETWKIDAFRDYDRGIGHDLYKITAGNVLGKRPEDITKDERQISGKISELSCGYMGGPNAFAKMGAMYGVVLPEDEALAIVRAWRKANPNIVRLWYDLDDAAQAAIRDPGAMYNVNRLQFTMRDGYLRFRLPSGRYLTYAGAHIDRQCPLCEGDGSAVEKGAIVPCKKCEGSGEVRPSVRYMGINQYTRKWERIETYAGKWAEQATQGTARDVLAHGLTKVEEAGYPVVLHVHDEILAETPDTPEFSAEGLAAIMATNPSWSLGLPLAAAGFETYRYRKD